MAEQAMKPCLVHTGQGFSVSYQSRFLYSTYAPQKAIVRRIAALHILPGTLFLCASPCLWYGLRELVEKLPADCFVLGIEADTALYALAKEQLVPIHEQNPQLPVLLLAPDELEYIVEIITSGEARQGRLPPLHTFRRVVLLEMSAGTAFYADWYRRIDFAAERAVASFWKNRMTLTTLGRLFSRNLFRNVAALPQSFPFAALLHTVRQPIIVVGAGESAERTITMLPRAVWERCCVLVVDAALPILRAHAITPHVVIAVESQLAIEKAYIGNRENGALLLADMTSRRQVAAHFPHRTSYFVSAFAPVHYVADLQSLGLLPPSIPALGSVGLVAVHMAVQLRAEATVPIFVTGLDFSFSLGATHARGAPAHIGRLCTTNRLHALANYDAAFRAGSWCVEGKRGLVYTDQALAGYAQLFAGIFSSVPALYDIGESGVSLGIARKTADAVIQATRHDIVSFVLQGEMHNLAKHVRAFFEQEKQALERLKQLLMHGETVAAENESASDEITRLLARREYLYLHFPDGYACHADDVSFLKRVRSEIDFFIKDFQKELLTNGDSL